jgi:hypothetical protein
MFGAYDFYGGEERFIQSLGGGGVAEGKRPLGRPSRKCKDNIKIDFKEIGWQGEYWIGLVEDSKHGNESSRSIKFGEFCG